jgi:hypothetical protein
MNNCAMRGIATLDEKIGENASGTKLSEAIRVLIQIAALYSWPSLLGKNTAI